MNSIIKQLPDRLANQIAAGEVIQKPASIVKELLENAVDAGATDITMIVKDAGKELIQVIDNGRGMNPIDARMCFERHATSKINKIEDLFNIKTMGFRGEALASIAAVAQVELTTKTLEEATGTRVVIEGGKFMEQNPVGTIEGTNLSVRNLFYNVPARRKFLKSNNSEWKHIMEEFIRVAMAYPGVSFKLIHNSKEQMLLAAGSHKSRVVDLMGQKFDKYLLPVNENTDYIQVTGFIGKPEVATRTKGHQYLFINNRFIKSPYIAHAIASAYEGLITNEEQPVFALYFDMDPSKIDVNVHPTKQEVKFEDERTIYSFVKSMLKHVLAMYNISPSIDFSIPSEYSQLDSLSRPQTSGDIRQASRGSLSRSFSSGNSAHLIDRTNFSALHTPDYTFPEPDFSESLHVPSPEHQGEMAFVSGATSADQDDAAADNVKSEEPADVLIWKDYIVSKAKSGLLFIHTARAQERIVYDRLLEKYLYGKVTSQQLLFPEMIQLAHMDAQVIEDMLDNLKKIGYEISSMGGNSYAVHGIPPEMAHLDIVSALEEMIESYKYTDDIKMVNGIDNAMKTAARRASVKGIKTEEEAHALIAQLFSCVQPEYSPHGQKIVRICSSEEIEKIF